MGGELPISRQVRPRYKTRNEAIVARLRAEAGADAPRNPHMKVKKLIAEIAIQMAILHGGDWRIQFEPENGIVVIARRLPQTP